MVMGDGIRRNIAKVEPSERDALRAAILALHNRFYPGIKTDNPPGGVSWWFKQDEIHQATHVHGGPEFVPWHREFTNRFEELIRQINPQLSLHYWDFADDPTNIPNANLGNGTTGTLDLLDGSFFGDGHPAASQDDDPDVGPPNIDAGNPWRAAGFYDPDAGTAGHPPFRGSYDGDPSGTNNPVDLPRHMARTAPGGGAPSSTAAQDAIVTNNTSFPTFRVALENLHNSAHGYIANVSPHIAFRDPLVFLLHSNMDRLYSRWQTDPAHPERLDPATVYGAETNLDVNVNGDIQNLTRLVEPWSTGQGEFHAIRPWEATHENQGQPHTYAHISVVAPACYDTNLSNFRIDEVQNPFNAVSGAFQILFNDVPEEETTWRAATIRVYTCSDTTFRVKPGTEPSAGSSFGVEIGQATAAHGSHEHLFQDVRLWFRYTAGAVGSAPVIDGPLPLVVQCVETGQEFPFELRANTIRRPTVAVELVLDQSGSMAWPAGTSNLTRLQVLKEAAGMFVAVMPEGNGVGLVRFDENAYPPNDPSFPGLPLTRITSAADRAAAQSAVDAHGAHGATSVGDGLVMGHSQLQALPPGEYDSKAMLLLTDGVQNQPVSIADAIAAGATDDRVHVIGLGNEFQVNTAALNTLSSNGLLVTGLLTPSTDDFFMVKKFFLQILAAVTNTSIVRDPAGFINIGTQIKVPFSLSETDISVRAILLTDLPLVAMSLRAPDGQVIDTAGAAAAGVTFARDGNTLTASFVAPLTLIGQTDASGHWELLLEVDGKRYQKTLGILRDTDQRAAGVLAGKGVRYCASVHTFSNLRMTAQVTQDSYEVGARMTCRAGLTEYGVPVQGRAQVSAAYLEPDGTPGILTLTEVSDGRFEGVMTAALPGIYRFDVAGSGLTFRGSPFTREQILTAAVLRGGDRPDDGVPPSGSFGDGLGDLMKCLVSEEVATPRFAERLKGLGVDLDALRKCIAEHRS